MKKRDTKIRHYGLLLIGLAGFLTFGGMTSVVEVHATQSEPKSLLDSTSVIINGEAWTFRTPPPPVSQRQVLSSHPRLYLTQANLAGIREKLSDAVYANDMNQLRTKADAGDALANALLYQLDGDVSRGTVARNWLLAGNYGDVSGLDLVGQWFEPVLVFDWVMPLLSSSEKSSAFGRIKANFGYDHRTATGRDWSLYWTRSWSRHPGIIYPTLALAIAGDGIEDVWAQEVLDLVYGESPIVLGPYGATKGAGILDILATISLDDGGGTQAGAYDSKIGQEYYTYFLHSFMLMGAWETATGQSMWARSPFFQKLPSYWAYEKTRVPGNLGSAMPEFLTGVYRNIDPDASTLARWMVNKWGRSKYVLVHRLILGDLRVLPKSPQELGLPTAKYIRGADLFVSSRSWDENSVTLTAFSRYSDTSRYEPSSGVFAITRGREHLSVPADQKKTPIHSGYHSGLWIYDPIDVKGTMGQSRTYWSNDRAFDAYVTVSNPVYFPGGPDNIVINNTYRGISTEYSKQLNAPGVRTARQTIVHIIDTNRDFIVVYDYTDVPTNLKRAWSMRLAVPPVVSGNTYSIPGMNTTIVAPASNTISWVGGVGDELKSPPPERIWYGNNKGGFTAGYSSNPDRAKLMGIGNLFVQPDNGAPEQLEFLVVNEVSDLPPVPVSRISDREVRFGDWHVTFASNGNFTVVNTGEFPPDTSPPSPPSNLDVQ